MLKIFIFITLLILSVYGCASNKVYIDTDKVQGLGVMVEFPDGKIVPIKVKRVISGNSIELTNNEKVLYIGVYIPQLYDIPQQAAALNNNLIMDNEIRLEFDKKQRDAKGRLLAYVYTLDGKFVNEEILRQGLAQALITPPNEKHKDLLLKAEEGAKNAKRGIWVIEK